MKFLQWIAVQFDALMWELRYRKPKKDALAVEVVPVAAKEKQPLI